MANVEIYTKDYCPYCHLAKSILRQHGADYNEHSLTEYPELFRDMVARADGRMTVPQIFIDGVPIGGADQLSTMEEQGKLKELLQRKQAA
ncbi:MAG: glutaredoxin 3 [Erythrobacter sp.]|nr:glutaredoxin 3 [Erythrobacter sp.]MBA4163077.1 glutaredoxin 3 [Erythrobacter sp.]